LLVLVIAFDLNHMYQPPGCILNLRAYVEFLRLRVKTRNQMARAGKLPCDNRPCWIKMEKGMLNCGHTLLVSIAAGLCFGATLPAGSEVLFGKGQDTSSPSLSVEVPVVAPAALDYLIVRESTAAVFDVISGDLELRLDLSDKVSGSLSDMRLSGTRDEILNALAAELGLDWFIFNGVIYVSGRTEALTRIVRLGDLGPAKVVVTLAESGLPTDKLSIEPSADGLAIAVSGPPKLLALAEAMIEGIPRSVVANRVEASPHTVKVRRGTDEENVSLP
jgi:hypothetical protein